MRAPLVLSLALWSGAALAVDEVLDFGSNPGNLRMFEHVPAEAQGSLPLILVLHGCTQDHGYAEQVGLLDLAEQHGVALVLAEQQAANNASRCFNWFEEADIDGDGGEALSLFQMVEAMQERHDIDATRVFVTGLSAGGAMTAVMLATRPDVFRAGAIFAGVSYRCGTGMSAAFTCMSGGSGSDREALGARVLGASAHTGPFPRVQIWTGLADATVAAQNADDLAQQWGAVHGLPLEPTAEDTLGPAQRARWQVDGESVVELLEIPAMGHGTPVDPGEGGCGTAGPLVLDVDWCASATAFEHFGLAAPREGEGEGEDDPAGCSCAGSADRSLPRGAALLALAVVLSRRRRAR